MLEASDADNLLEQFEDASPDFEDDFRQISSSNGHLSGTGATSSSKNPKKTSNIFKAVQNHFAATVAANSESNSANGKCRRLPRIGEYTIHIQ